MYDRTKDPLRDAKDKIILALDVSNLSDAKKMIEMLGPHVGCIKIGFEAQTEFGGPVMVQMVHDAGAEIFYDGKFNDIPNTIAASSKAIAGKNVKMFNVHASMSNEALKAAALNKGASLLLAVTVLTSINEEECQKKFGGTVEEKVLQFAREAKEAGADGIVCSSKELKMLSQHEDLKILKKVTPGIQPEWMQKNDQKRVMTPGEAIKAGADYLVIGRAITGHADPLQAIELIAEEISKAMKEKEMVA